MSYNSHRRPTPVPTDSIFVFGREIDQLPSISESPPDKPGQTHLSSMEALRSSQERLEKGDITSSTVGKEWLPASITTTNEKTTIGTTDEPIDTHVEQAPLMQKTDIKVYNITSEPYEDGKENKKEFYQEGFLTSGPEEAVQEALLALFFSIFNLAWSVGIGFWHILDGNLDAGYLTLAIVIASGIVTELAYIFNGKVKKGSIWSTSKLLSLLFLIPCTLPIFVSLSNLVYSVKESQDSSYKRPWTNSRIIFLVQSLTLIIPQCVLQTCLLMEEVDNFPSIKGCVIAAGVLILTGDLAFSRIRFDSVKKFDRFAMGTEKYIRYAILWGCKALWLLTFCCIIVSIRILYGRDNILALVIGIAGLQVIYEIPVLLSSMEICRKMQTVLVGSFFMLPQFAALISLIIWVNVDMSVYSYNIGSCILGTFFGAESLCILGWLLDRCTGRDHDFIPNYPHIFGNMYIRLRNEKNNTS